MVPLTPTETRVFAAIQEAAERGERCPSNERISDLANCGVGNASWIVAKIEAKGFITVQRGAMARVVTIVATGQTTAGKIKKLHWRFHDEAAAEAEMQGERRRLARGTGIVRTPVPGLHEIKKDEPEPVYTQRDPCGFCGVRGDVGCKHRRAQ